MSYTKKISELSNVSVATVSRVLHKSDKVKPETRQRVEEAIQTLKLDPQKLIRGSRTSTNVVGVVVPDLMNNFFTEIISGIQDEARKSNISLFVCNTQEDDQSEIHYLHLLSNAHVKGIIITPVSDNWDSVNNEYLQLLYNSHVPIVLVDRDVKYSNYDSVFIDNMRGAFDATRLLINNGHTKIAVIAGPQSTLPGRERLNGYREAYAASHIQVDEKLIFYGDFSLKSGEILTRKILDSHSDVTAIFSQNNLMTLGCVEVLLKAGLKIPDDISLIGFDEMSTLEEVGIDLTVVGRPSYEMGRHAMTLMSKAISNKSPRVPKRTILMPSLKICGSEKMLKTNHVEE